ncbi:hypothetical protein A167_03270 [Alcanivorax sp. S71-1-4]|jgi:uncharacterized protein|uniref:DUF1289 domain-containing protein n=1 Tax=Alcanivorax sp. S71-1-4 TaxID=1177159 RepID=UPI0013572FF5|nr:DUF1289 domain-containing protein [Alcanivorax sp. S71-1-4]KAF0806257.1 hypothetical protein A167_03270 [Alcanivorax sp. S71-1-4]
MASDIPVTTLKRVSTPCIGVCSTVFGDTVCRGCKRFAHEVVNWNAYTDAEKAIVWQRLDSLLKLVVGNYFLVTDAGQLRAAMEYQNLRFQSELSPEGWVPDLLKAAGSQRLDYHQFGLTPLFDPATQTARALYDTISLELYALSRAHHERSFVQAERIPMLVEEAARALTE